MTTSVALLAVQANAWYYRPGSIEDKTAKIYGLNPVVQASAVSAVLARKSSSYDRIFIFGSEPQILYYARRRSATRYIYIYPLMANYEHTAERRAQLFRELATSPPKLIVTVFIGASFGRVSSTHPIFDEIHRLLEGPYRIIALLPISSGQISQLIEGPAATSAWESSPYWYNGPASYALAIWEYSPTNVARVMTPDMLGSNASEQEVAALKRRAYALMKRGEMVEAILELKKILKHRPDDPEAGNNFGLALFNLKRYQEATAQLQYVIRRNPRFAPAFANLGLVNEQVGNFKEAERAYQAAIRINPTLVEPRVNLGDLLYSLGDRNRALRAYQGALEVAPSDSRIQQRLESLARSLPPSADDSQAH